MFPGAAESDPQGECSSPAGSVATSTWSGHGAGLWWGVGSVWATVALPTLLPSLRGKPGHHISHHYHHAVPHITTFTPSPRGFTITTSPVVSHHHSSRDTTATHLCQRIPLFNPRLTTT